MEVLVLWKKGRPSTTIVACINTGKVLAASREFSNFSYLLAEKMSMCIKAHFATPPPSPPSEQIHLYLYYEPLSTPVVIYKLINIITKTRLFKYIENFITKN